MKEKIKNLSNKKIVITSLCAFAIVLLLGLTYAIWSRTFNQTGENISTYDCFDITFSENTDGITMENGYPISDEEGLKSEAYEVTITNTCKIPASYNVILNKLNTSTLDNSHVKVAVDNNVKLLSESKSTMANISNASEARIISNGILAGEKSKILKIRSWMDEATSIEEGTNKSFSSKITIDAVTANNNLLATKIMKSYNQVNVDNYRIPSPSYEKKSEIVEENATVTIGGDGNSYVVGESFSYIYNVNGIGNYLSNGTTVTSFTNDMVGKYTTGENSSLTYNKALYKITEVTDGIVTKADIIKPAEDYSTTGIVYMDDDEGTSYVLRGKITDNYVSFANSLWRIVRINGDGSIRLVSQNDIGRSRYNTQGTLPKYVGYTYDNSKSCTNDSPCYTTEGTSSTLKTYLENWYESNLKSYDSKIALTSYCNDTSVNYDEDNNGWLYGMFNRHCQGDSDCKSSPNLKCSNTKETYGGLYKLKIGLLTADEVMIGGLYNSMYYNGISKVPQGNYLYNDLSAKTLTPAAFYDNGDGTYEVVMYNYGRELSDYVYTTANNYVRPVINLNADVQVASGEGTKENPYVID